MPPGIAQTARPGQETSGSLSRVGSFSHGRGLLPQPRRKQKARRNRTPSSQCNQTTGAANTPHGLGESPSRRVGPGSFPRPSWAVWPGRPACCRTLLTPAVVRLPRHSGCPVDSCATGCPCAEAALGLPRLGDGSAPALPSRPPCVPYARVGGGSRAGSRFRGPCRLGLRCGRFVAGPGGGAVPGKIGWEGVLWLRMSIGGRVG